MSKVKNLLESIDANNIDYVYGVGYFDNSNQNKSKIVSKLKTVVNAKVNGQSVLEFISKEEMNKETAQKIFSDFIDKSTHGYLEFLYGGDIINW